MEHTGIPQFSGNSETPHAGIPWILAKKQALKLHKVKYLLKKKIKRMTSKNHLNRGEEKAKRYGNGIYG